jgi:FxsC-like protein
MAEPDPLSSTDGPELPELPELRLLRESGAALESMAPAPDTGAPVRLRAEAVRRGLLPAHDNAPETDLAAIGDDLERGTPAFDIDAHSGRLREAARARGLLQPRERVLSPVSAAADDAPYFFLSYAHAPRGDARGEDPDLWVTQLYDDLCYHITSLADLAPGQRAGFIDRERQGEEWPWRLSKALATCRVFVPLYSRQYFKSEDSGKEWFAFYRRALNHASANGGSRVETIVPALWIPMRDDRFPEAARSVQFRPADFGPLYAEHGFYGIMKARRWRDAYKKAVYLLARRIVAAAEASPIEPEDAAQYKWLHPAFGGEGETGPRDKLLRLTVVAPRRYELPADRDPNYYGANARDWNPYREGSMRSLADHAADLARSLSYTPDVGDLYEHGAELLSGEPPSGPEVLLIDPWAAMQSDGQDVLRRLDRLDKPWVQIVVVWNQQDMQLQADADKIRSALESVLPRTLREGRATSALAVRGVPSLEDFSTVLPTVIAAAGRHYLRYASAHPA